ncbi:MAG: tRNA 2-thiouridine(34) synthase MnmA [Patescibacteria group bacterium]
MDNRKPKVLVGMSGGVDSSLSAALLLEQGYEVIGGFMKNWTGSTKVVEGTEEFIECDWRTERRDAMRVAAQLGIPFMTFDFEKEYRQKVVDYMVKEYAAGRTPNPDVMCNKFMKFDLFMKEADKLGCAFVATGHYARMEDGKLLAGVDPNKDQTYFLCQMPREVLKRVLFPVGGMLKTDVRTEAEKRNLVVAGKKDSQGVCFIGEINMTEFLQDYIEKKPGKIVTTSGELVGDHEGLPFYTIGQREGLKIGGLETPYYVVAKNAERNELVVSSNFHEALFRDELVASEMNWLVEPKLSVFTCSARIRYRQPLEQCNVGVVDNGKLQVTFATPQRAVTPGQFIVFYDDDVVIGGAVIQ